MVSWRLNAAVRSVDVASAKVALAWTLVKHIASVIEREVLWVYASVRKVPEKAEQGSPICL